MSDQAYYDQVYKDNEYVMLTLRIDKGAVKLAVKAHKEESVAIWAKYKGGKILFNFGGGDEEYDEDELPDPIRKLVGTMGGGPNGNAANLPPVSALIRNYCIRPYAEYASDFASRYRAGDKTYGKALPKTLYRSLAMSYLDALGAPLYI